MANFEAALKAIEKFGLVDGIQENVINDNSVASVLGSRVPGFEQLVPFGREDVHETGVESRDISRSERHYSESVLFVVRREERQLVFKLLRLLSRSTGEIEESELTV